MSDREDADLGRLSRSRLARMFTERRSNPASDPDSGRRPSKEAEAIVEGMDLAALTRPPEAFGLAELVQTGRYDGLIPDEPPEDLEPDAPVESADAAYEDERLASDDAEDRAASDAVAAPEGDADPAPEPAMADAHLSASESDGTPEPSSVIDEHVLDRRLARLHLRTGGYQLARAELEAMAGLGALDVEGFLDLAESRWRSGDLAAAGDAVVEYLESGGDEALAYVIAAEASVAIGRVGDARRLARRALDRLTVPLEVVFAGQARSEVWPASTDAEAQPVSTLFTSMPPEAYRGGRIGLAGDAGGVTVGRPLDAALAAGQLETWGAPIPVPADTLPLGLEEPAPADLEALIEAEASDDDAPIATAVDEAPATVLAEPLASEADGPTASEAADGRPGQAADEPTAATAPLGPVAPAFDAGAALDDAARAIADGNHPAAAIHLSLVLRAQPALARAVLALIGDDLGGPAVDLVRGDAHRLAGDEDAAQRAFANALRWAEDASLGGPAAVPTPAASDPAQVGHAATQLEALLDHTPAVDPNQIALFEGPAPASPEPAAAKPEAAELEDPELDGPELVGPEHDDLEAEGPEPLSASDTVTSTRRPRPGALIRRPPTSRAPHARFGDAPRDPRSHS